MSDEPVTASKQIIEDLAFLRKKVAQIELQVNEINDDLHVVKPSYVKKLKKIDKGRFINQETFEKELGI